MINLFTLKAGETARGYFIEQIKIDRLAKGYAYGEQVLVLPSGELMSKARQEGIACVGLDFLASHLLNGVDDFRQNYVQLNRRSQEILVRRILEERGEQGEPFSYFEKLVKKQGFVKAFTSLIGQLRRSNVTPEELELAFEIWQEEKNPGNLEKNQDVVYVFKKYEELLIENNWYDLEGKYALAVEYMDQGLIKNFPWKKIYISDFNALEPMQFLFIQKLAQQAEVFVGLNYEYPREKMYRAVDMTYSALAQQVAALEPELERKPVLQYLVDNIWRQKALSPAPELEKDELRIWQFTSRENEIRQVLTDIKEQLIDNPELKPNQFCISMRNLNEYNGLSTIAEEYGIPLSLPVSLPLGQQALVELVFGLFQGNTYNRQGWENYVRLLNNPLLKTMTNAPVERVEELEQDNYFQSVGHFYNLLEHWVEEGKEGFSADGWLKDKFLSSMLAFMNKLEPNATVAIYCSGIIELLEGWQLEKALGRAHREQGLKLDAIKLVLDTKKKLLDTLEAIAEDYKLCKWEERQLDKSEFIELLQSSLEGQSLHLNKKRTEAVAVIPALTIQGMPFDYLYILGMREGEFPGRNTEDWFYNDGERKHFAQTHYSKEAKRQLRRKYYIFNKEEQNALNYDMGIEMPDTAASYAQEDFIFGMAIAQAKLKLTLSYHQDDVAGASSYIDGVKKILPQVEINSWLAENKLPASWAEVEAKGRLCPKEHLSQELLMAAEADEQRKVEESLYNGRIKDEALIKTISKKKTFSASRLKVYAFCPFEYLVTKIWHEEGLQKKDEFLPANTRGKVLHRTAQLLVEGYMQDRISVLGDNFEQMLEELQARMENCLDIACQEEGVDKTAFYETDRANIEYKLKRWVFFELAEQLGDRGFRPLATELNMERLDMQAVASDGERVKFSLTGTLDRVDVNNRGELYITDYKSSSVPSGADMKKGLDLQMPVYILAAHKLLKEKPELFVMPEFLKAGAEAVNVAQRVAGAGYLSFNSTKSKKVERFDQVVIEEKKPPKFNKDGSLSKNQPKNDKVWEIWEEKFLKLLGDYVQGIYQGKFSLDKRKKCDEYCPLKEVCRFSKLKKKEGDEADE